MIASLGMYDWAPCQPANDRLWGLIRDNLRAKGMDAPDALTRGEGAYWAAWQSPDLLLSQTCGFPFRAKLHDAVTLVGTPDFGLEGCAPGYYFSVFIARADDSRGDIGAFDGARFAYNEGLSQSGWAAAQNHVAPLGIHLSPFLQTGGHLLSARAVAEGRADLAAVDAVTWRLIVKYNADLAAELRVVGRTDPTPGLPYITAKGRNPERLFDGVAAAIAALTAADRATLGLRGLIAIPAARYLAVPTPPSPDQIAP
ncbi:MAG: PhnD/SsuA/transferrin family substrate-binding protein [Paracoccaceae bacterium]